MVPGPLEPLPELFVERLRRIVPLDWSDVCLASFAGQKPAAFRVSRLRATDEQVRGELQREGFELAPVEWLEGAYTVAAAERRRLAETAAAAESRIYIQNLSSMLAPWYWRPGRASRCSIWPPRRGARPCRWPP